MTNWQKRRFQVNENSKSSYWNFLSKFEDNLKQRKMKGIKYLTDEKGKRIAVQIDLNDHKNFIQDYLEYIEDRTDILNSEQKETVSFDEVVAKFEKLHGKEV